MLHVFGVNQGHMMTFDVSLALEKVADLKKAVGSFSGVHSKKQVMLVKDGQAMEDSVKVGSYVGGTESNPFYVFDLTMIEKESISLDPAPQVDGDFSVETLSALSMPPDYATMTERTKLAIRINEVTQKRMSIIRSLDHDERLMYQGWQAAIVNLNKAIDGFEQRISGIHGRCTALIKESADYSSTLQGFDGIIDMLRCIPVHPSLQSSDGNSMKTLLTWIESKCDGTDLCSLAAECKQQSFLVHEEKLTQLNKECWKTSGKGRNPQMRSDARIRDILAAQEQVIAASESEVKIQAELAQGFVRNLKSAREMQQENLLDHDALMKMSESHVTQLTKMHKIEKLAREAIEKCFSNKQYIAQKFHTSLRWLYAIEDRISKCDKELALYQDRIVEFNHKLAFISVVKKTPEIYFAALVECVRRRTFAHAFIQWSDGVLTTSQISRDREVLKRKEFKSFCCNHFILKLFRGFSDKPPSIAKRPMKKFDVNLPEVSREDIIHLSEQFPQLQARLAVISEPFEIPWQLTYSGTTTTRAVTFQPSDATSQSTLVTASILSNTSTVDAGASSSIMYHSKVQPITSYPVGDFVLSAIQPIDEPVAESALSPPIDSIELGSPDSGEFFSILPLSDQAKAQSFVSVLPTTKMCGIPEEDLPTSRQHSGFMKVSLSQDHHKLQPQVISSDEDEIFHSFTNDMDNDDLLYQLRELENDKKHKEEQLAKLAKKYKDEVNNLQQSVDEVSADFDRRMSDVIGQLESERKERRRAWEKESEMAKTCEELKQNVASLTDANVKMCSDLSLKNQFIEELIAEAALKKNACEIEVADANEKAAKEVWEARQEVKMLQEALESKVAALDGDLKEKSITLASADDRIQELEQELSAAEAKMMSYCSEINSSKAEIELLQNDLKIVQSCLSEKEKKLTSALEDANEAGSRAARSEDQTTELKSMLAAYEVELEDAKRVRGELKKCSMELCDLSAFNDRLTRDLGSSENIQREQVKEINKLKKEASEMRTLVKDWEVSMEQRMGEIQESHEQSLLEVKQDTEDSIRKMFEANKKKICDIENEHRDDVIRMHEEHQCELEQTVTKIRGDMDELQADHFKELAELQNEYDQLLKDHNTQKDHHQSVMGEMMSQHEPSLPRPMSSSMMSSSNEESDSTPAKLDNLLVTSLKDELEREKEAIKSKHRRKEEAAIKRRQVVFNSAIKRVTSAKDAEIGRLKQQLSDSQAMMSSATPSFDIIQPMMSSVRKEREKAAISNFQPLDIVVVIYDVSHRHHVVLSTSHVIHFLHSDSDIQLKSEDCRPGFWTLARFGSKEYCLAKKANNRFNLPVGTKFFRVKLTPFSKST